MGRLISRIVTSFVLTLILPVPFLVAAEPTHTEAHTQLTAVTRREAYVFASTIDGLFRAPLATKRWERLKTPPEMPLNGTFAKLPEKSPLVIYIVYRDRDDKAPRGDLRYGLYLSRDNGTNWELISERDDFGETLLLPNGILFAVTGRDRSNTGNRLLRSPDMGKTWRDITGKGLGQIQAIEPDPKHPGLVRAHVWSIRVLMFEAENENYEWKSGPPRWPVDGRRPSDLFFARSSSSTGRLYMFRATLANYFTCDFGNLTQGQALEVVPLKERYEFASGAGVKVKMRVVFHFDAETLWAERRKALDKGQPLPKPEEPSEKFADQPGGTEFWGIRVESADLQVAKFPGDRRTVSETFIGGANDPAPQARAVKYEVFKLAPSSAYERELDLGKLFDFSKPGEYRVQIVYDSARIPSQDRRIWDGYFTSPVFTVVIRP